MEYFDFEQASTALRQHDGQAGSHVPMTPSSSSANASVERTDPDGRDSPQPAEPCRTLESGLKGHELVYPNVFRPANPCDYCRTRQLSCRIVCVNERACSSCVALSRVCSFLDSVLEPHAEISPEFETWAAQTGFQAEVPFPCETVVPHTGATYAPPDDSESPDAAAQKKSGKCGARFSRESVRILKTWLAAHAQHPYPSEQEKEELRELTGLKGSQVSNWLANARRRGKARALTRGSSPRLGEARSGPVDIPTSSRPAVSQDTDMTPLERWKHSPPEHEAASVTAIADAVAISAWSTDKGTPTSPASLNDGQRDSSAASSLSMFFHAPSLSSQETRYSSGSDLSFASAFSHGSQLARGSPRNAPKRERRRRRRPALARMHESNGVRMFQCTFCTDSFKTKHDWQRHEKSLHLSLDKWVCAPEGGSISIPGGDKMCAYCSQVNPSDDHIETHNFQQCREKSLAERTFYRKDHLRQHLRLVHDCKFDMTMESWRTSTEALQSRCGFCNAGFKTWQARVDHLASHFRAGAQMAEWKGDWGFEPHIEQALQDEMPPWLIDHERRTMVPFSASERLCTPGNWGLAPESTTDDPIAVLTDSKCYKRLEQLLAAWVQDQIGRGMAPNDVALQDQARIIVYLDPDSWNQTAADDEQWLERFKRKIALSPVPGAAVNNDDTNLDHPFSSFRIGTA